MSLDHSLPTTMVVLHSNSELAEEVAFTLRQAGYQTLTDADGPQIILSPKRKGLVLLRMMEESPAIPPDTLHADRVVQTMQIITAQLHSCPSLAVAAQFILEEIQQLFGARHGWMLAANDGRLQQLAGSTGSEDAWESLAAWCHLAAEHERPLVENPPMGRANLLAIPITHHGRLLGVLALADRIGGFSECHIPILESLTFPLCLRLAHGLQHADSPFCPDRLDAAIDSVESSHSTAALEQVKEQFVCLASHELQSPLAVIKGYTEQLLWALANQRDCAVVDGLGTIARQVQRLQHLIRDMLDFSALSMASLRLEMQPLDLTALLQQTLDELTVAHQRRIDTCLAPAVGLHGDPARLEQVVRNLVENAIKYSPADAPITVSLLEKDATVEIAVSDLGDGISAEEIPSLFTPFYRTRTARHTLPSGGQGLGLALSRQLVERHGGAIRVESTPGVGTTFIVVLPRR